HAETHDGVVLDREDPDARTALRRRLALGMRQKTEGVRGARRQRLLARFVRSAVPGHPHSDSRSRCGLDLGARLERRLATLLVFGMEGEDATIRRAHRDRVVPKRARGGPRRGIAVARGSVPHDVLECDLGTKLALQAVDPIYRDERPADVSRDRVEDLELLAEALATRGPLHVEDADDLVAGPQRHAHGLARLRIAATKTVVVHRAHEDHPLASARDPSGDSLVDALLVAERHPDAHRCADAQPV